MNRRDWDEDWYADVDEGIFADLQGIARGGVHRWRRLSLGGSFSSGAARWPQCSTAAYLRRYAWSNRSIANDVPC
ncbi:hypothetical protein GCM10020220_028480 [Nonomuraea rubra]